jgi:redox-sensitive bicupin YhaK (pirin superfamily)
MADPVLQTFPLGFQWPTFDPFLFCVHHLDRYPAGDGRMGPAASLAGRQIGQDFEGLDGWRMYHGTRVPGFPPHPHRGFETVTYVRQGLIDHTDSLGAAARFGRGDVQWLTAGSGIVHAEMFPLLDEVAPNTTELFQIWLNLPADAKLADPHFTMLWDGDIPRVTEVTEGGATTEVTVIAGALPGAVPPSPPPRSWASRPEADVAIWHLRLQPGARWTLPPAAGPDTVRVLYAFEGGSLHVDGHQGDLAAGTGAAVRADEPVAVSSDDGVEVLVLQGRPIAEPVARYGPFVMNHDHELQQAFADYRRTGFGGWPWPSDDPVHEAARGRFARHADGHVEEVAATPGPADGPARS